MADLSTQPYKGTRDFFPKDQRIQNWMFDRLKTVVEGYGYLEYNGPMLEPFELYAAKTGQEIVNQQLYWLMDRGERKLAVRPEMTPTLARMVASQIQELPRPIRWYSIPNLWRYERPQRGRLREHWQLNVDVLGGDALLADVEVLKIASDLILAFGGESHIVIKINNRKLMDQVFTQKMGLDAGQAQGITKALDARAKIGEEAYFKWVTDDLKIESSKISALEEFFKKPLSELQALYPGPGADELTKLFELGRESGLGTQMMYDPMVMRGLDYYTGTVFEIYDQSPQNNRAMFGGGRYDNLVGMFGKNKLSGVGFGMGDVTLRHFLEVHGLLPIWSNQVDVFLTLPRAQDRAVMEQLAQKLRKSGLKVVTPLEVGGFGVQLKFATKLEAQFAVLLGEAELSRSAVVVKDLALGTQTEVPFDQLEVALKTKSVI